MSKTASRKPRPEGREADFGIALALGFTAFATELRASLEADGYSDLHRWFGYVARNLEAAPLTLTDLARLLEMTSPGALKIVQQMEAEGYLERSPDLEDGRAKRLQLTRRGHAALAAARRFHERFERELVSRLGTRKVQAFREVLGEIVARHEAEGGRVPLRPM